MRTEHLHAAFRKLIQSFQTGDSGLCLSGKGTLLRALRRPASIWGFPAANHAPGVHPGEGSILNTHRRDTVPNEGLCARSIPKPGRTLPRETGDAAGESPTGSDCSVTAGPHWAAAGASLRSTDKGLQSPAPEVPCGRRKGRRPVLTADTTGRTENGLRVFILCSGERTPRPSYNFISSSHV